MSALTTKDSPSVSLQSQPWAPLARTTLGGEAVLALALLTACGSQSSARASAAPAASVTTPVRAVASSSAALPSAANPLVPSVASVITPAPMAASVTTPGSTKDSAPAATTDGANEADSAQTTLVRTPDDTAVPELTGAAGQEPLRLSDLCGSPRRSPA